MTTTVDQLPEISTGLYIDGVPVAAAETLRVVDPGDGVSLVGRAASATSVQAADAVTAAHRAFPAWSALSPAERAAALTAALVPLEADRPATAEILSRENGKIRLESIIDSVVFEHRCRLAIDLAGDVESSYELAGPPYRTRVRQAPLGVVTIIVPFNWPLAILGASLGYALMAGNTVVVKPPPTAPLATARTVALVAAALPPGVVNVITGADAEVGPTLITDPRVRKVCFTGSVGGGKRIMAMASDNLTRVALELGGNDPAIILPDAVLSADAFQNLYHGTFDTTGQVCMAVKRLYVHRSRYEEVIEGLTALLTPTVLGHGLAESTTMGPLHRAQQKSFVTDLLAEARSRGAEIRELGSEAPADGHFLRPSLVLDPPDDTGLVAEEQFGPTLPIIPFDDEADAVARANDTWAGLTSSVWTADLDHAAALAEQLHSGFTFVNAHGAGSLDERAPFGGRRHSGMGREMGIEGLREFMDTHAISFASPPPPIS